MDEGLVRQRALLVRVSVVVLLYNLLGGSIGKEVSIFYGAMILKRADWLYSIVLLLLVYAIIRYRIYTTEYSSRLKTGFNNCFQRSVEFQNYASEVFSREVDKHGINVLSLNNNPILKRGRFLRKLDFSMNYDSGALQRVTLYDVKVDYLKILKMEILSILICCRDNRDFSDYLMPLLLFLLSVISIYYRLISVII